MNLMIYFFKANFIKDPKNAAKELILQKSGHSGIGEDNSFIFGVSIDLEQIIIS